MKISDVMNSLKIWGQWCRDDKGLSSVNYAKASGVFDYTGFSRMRGERKRLSEQDYQNVIRKLGLRPRTRDENQKGAGRGKAG